jgi:hypothetical protein
MEPAIAAAKLRGKHDRKNLLMKNSYSYGISWIGIYL